MVQLTEDMIVARTRVSNMASVKKLNCWGADLTDISIVRKLEGVEMLSLSLNSLSSLSDFQHCRNLQELFVRKNKINSLAELVWLRDLPKLRHLWLAENPCAEGNPRYRQTVIHNLPQLEKLDNIIISSEERAEARFADNLEDPREEIYEERRMSIESVDSRESSPEVMRNWQENREMNEDYMEPKFFREQPPPSVYRSLRSQYSPFSREGSIIQDESYMNERRLISRCDDRESVSQIGREEFRDDRLRMDMMNMQRIQGRQRRRNRNSNMLSAVLCLLREMDIPSLEVVETAVRCRMEELDD